MTFPIFVSIGGRAYRMREGGYIEGAFTRANDALSVYWRIVNRHGPKGQLVRAAAGFLYPKPIGPVYEPWQQETAA